MSKADELDIVFMKAGEPDEGEMKFEATCNVPEVMVELGVSFGESLSDINVDIHHVEWSEEPANGKEVVVLIAEALANRIFRSVCFVFDIEVSEGDAVLPVTHLEGKRIH